MELRFLGTGAAEGNPAAYCRCPACQGVRQRGGIEIRTRSSLRIGLHHQIDVSPDLYAQALAADLYDVEHILVTHTHEDHFAFSALADKKMSEQTNGKPLSLWMSEPARVCIEEMTSHLPLSEGDRRWIGENVLLHGLEYFREYSIGGLTVRTIKGNHTAHGEDEWSINYHVRLPGGRTLLYACDTGYYREETWSRLSGLRIDTLILECTFAGRTDRGERPDGHLDLPSFFATLQRMAEIGFIDSQTAVYATHFNPHQGLGHFDIQARLQRSPWHATAAYDGLRVEA